MLELKKKKKSKKSKKTGKVAPLSSITIGNKYSTEEKGQYGIFQIIPSAPLGKSSHYEETEDKSTSRKTPSSVTSTGDSNLDTVSMTSTSLISASKLYLNPTPIKLQTVSRSRGKSTGASPSHSRTSGSQGSASSAQTLPSIRRGSVPHPKTAPGKTARVFLSEKQSRSLSECGLSVPGAPPATPTPKQLQKIEYVPSLNDVRSQQSLQKKLKSLRTREKEKSEQRKIELSKQLKVVAVEQEKEIKRHQRNIIYALNKIMTEAENARYIAFVKDHGLRC